MDGIRVIEKSIGEEAKEFVLRPGMKSENKGYFFNCRYPKAVPIPDGWYIYDIRGSDYDPGRLISVEHRVLVNHAGTFATQHPIKFPSEHPEYLYLKGRGGYSFGY